MQARLKIFAVTCALVLGVVSAVLAVRGSADTPFVDRVLALTTTRVDYSIPVGVVPAVPETSAIESARAFVSAPASALVRSVRLGLYSDLKTKGLLVWVVDLDGVQLQRMGHSFSRRGLADPDPLTRVVVFVSATERNFVVGTLSSNLK
jgi:hypothetical protein